VPIQFKHQQLQLQYHLPDQPGQPNVLQYNQHHYKSKQLPPEIQRDSLYVLIKQRSAPPLAQQKSSKNLTVIARKRIDVARRLFKMFDKDESGYLTEDEIPFIIEETYKELGQSYKPSREDVKSYMKMVDTNGDGRISLPEFEEIILRSLKNAGFEIY
jgi:hypothetical protein